MTRVEIDGTAYDLRFDMGALEEIEETYGGGIEQLQKVLDSGKKVKVIRNVFRIMANAGKRYRKEPEDATGEEVLGLTMVEMMQLMATMMAEIKRSSGVAIEDPEEKAAKAAAIAKGGYIVDANELPGENGKNAEAGVS